MAAIGVRWGAEGRGALQVPIDSANYFSTCLMRLEVGKLIFITILRYWRDINHLEFLFRQVTATLAHSRQVTATLAHTDEHYELEEILAAT